MEALYLGVRLGERTGKAHRVRAMSKMEGELQVYARSGRGVRVFEVMVRGVGYRMEEDEVARWQRKIRDS